MLNSFTNVPIIPIDVLILIFSYMTPSSLFAMTNVSKFYYSSIKCDHDRRTIIIDAISNKYTKLFKWCTNDKFNIKYYSIYQREAAKSCSFEILKYIHVNNPFYTLNESLLIYVIDRLEDSEQLKILKWARENGCPWDAGTCSCAAQNGHFEILKWARENGCPWDAMTCSNAAQSGHFEILKWARENGCPWDKYTCAYAALNGHFEILKWARENGCPWDVWTCTYAAKNGHFDILKWARKNGCPWNEETCANAAKNGHFEILKWARENGCPR